MKGWIVAIIGCGAAFGAALLLLALVILYRYNAERKKAKQMTQAQETQKKRLGYIGPGSTTKCKAKMSPFVPQLNFTEGEGNTSIITPDQMHLRRIVSNNNPYSDLLVMRERDKAILTEDSDEGKGSAYGSEEEVNTKLAAMSKSMVHYSLAFDTSSSTLTVKVMKATNLPMKYRRNCSSFIKLSLSSSKRNKVSYYTNVAQRTLNPDFNESFNFRLSDEEERLKLSVFVKYHLKDKFVGESVQVVSKDTLTDLGKPSNVSANLDLKKTKKKKTLTENEDLGQLFVLLQYQTEASRVKVFIRKAENLPKINRPIRQGDYYVILNLMKDNTAITFKETKWAHGSNPIWNEPFLFDIPTNTDINDFWFQFVVMRGRRSTKDNVVGHVLIGSDTTSTGIAHWNETLQPRSVELARWHSILPYR